MSKLSAAGRDVVQSIFTAAQMCTPFLIAQRTGGPPRLYWLFDAENAA
jgi:hypothetical protein